MRRLNKNEALSILYRAKKAYRSFMNGSGEREVLSVINYIEEMERRLEAWNKLSKNQIAMIEDLIKERDVLKKKLLE